MMPSVTRQRVWGTEITYDNGSVTIMESDTRELARYRARWHKGKGPNGLVAIKTRTVQKIITVINGSWETP